MLEKQALEPPLIGIPGTAIWYKLSSRSGCRKGQICLVQWRKSYDAQGRKLEPCVSAVVANWANVNVIYTVVCNLVCHPVAWVYM